MTVLLHTTDVRVLKRSTDVRGATSPVLHVGKKETAFTGVLSDRRGWTH